MIDDIHVLLYQKDQINTLQIPEKLLQEKGIILHNIASFTDIKHYGSLYPCSCLIYDCDILSSTVIKELEMIPANDLMIIVLANQGTMTHTNTMHVIYKPSQPSISFVHSLIVNIKLFRMPVRKETLAPSNSTHIVAIGASTGGPHVIETILKEFTAKACGVVIVQHMNDGNLLGFIKYLNEHCIAHVTSAKENELIQDGHVYVAIGKRHVTVRKEQDGFHMHYTNGQKVNCVCPSIDVLFHSLAKQAGNQACGVLLSGMGEDGADGLKAMKEHGAYTIIQDEKSCDVYGMPKAAKRLHAQCIELAYPKMAAFLNGLQERYKQSIRRKENGRKNHGS